MDMPDGMTEEQIDIIAAATGLKGLNVKKTAKVGLRYLCKKLFEAKKWPTWTKQRNHLVEAFLPYASLAKILPVSNARSQFAIEQRLPKLQGVWVLKGLREACAVRSHFGSSPVRSSQ